MTSRRLPRTRTGGGRRDPVVLVVWENPQLVAEDDPELDAPRHCGGDPRGDLVNELVDVKTVATRFCILTRTGGGDHEPSC